MIPLIILAVVNMIGLLFARNYEGAVVGSVVGTLIAFLGLEIKAKQ